MTLLWLLVWWVSDHDDLVSMTAADRAVLDMAHGRTGWGCMYGPYEGRGKQADYVVWSTHSKQVVEVADFFTTHPLQSKKAIDFALWAPAARAQGRRRRGRRDDALAAVMAQGYDGLRAMGRGHR
jgi:hypothetical protein